MKKIKKIIGLALIGGLVIGNSVIANAATGTAAWNYFNNPNNYRILTVKDYNNSTYRHSAVIRLQAYIGGYYQYNVTPRYAPGRNAHNESWNNYTYAAVYGEYDY